MELVVAGGPNLSDSLSGNGFSKNNSSNSFKNNFQNTFFGHIQIKFVVINMQFPENGWNRDCYSTISIFLVKSFVYKIYQISKNQSDSGMKLRPENETFKNKYFDKKKILRLNCKGKFWYHMILTAVWKWKEILMFTIFHI